MAPAPTITRPTAQAVAALAPAELRLTARRLRHAADAVIIAEADAIAGIRQQADNLDALAAALEEAAAA